MRVFNFKGIVGNNTILNILSKSLISGNFPKFSIFQGESGIGKSSCAEISAMRLTCENPNGAEPCCQCPSCRNAMESIVNQTVGARVRKYNLAQLANKSDLLQLINKIFRLDYGDRNMVFILEEPQALMENFQTALLEELERIPNNVYVMFCTTKPSKLLPDIRNRAIKFRFSRLNSKSSRLLIDNIFEKYRVNVDDSLKNKILGYCKGVPREIVLNTEYVIKNQIFSDEELDYLFDSVSSSTVRNLLKSSVDFKEFLKLLDEILNEVSAIDLLNSVKSYLMECAFLAKDLSFRETNLTAKDKSFAKELGGDLILQIYSKLFKLPYNASVDDVKFDLIVCSKLIEKKLKPMIESSGVSLQSKNSETRDRESEVLFREKLSHSNSFKRIESSDLK